ncbi:unnamed protein product [Rangifer tarandus platyrhynchus]|uniref:Uncharacterized protein n=1 Tax=Rangifer tarandus platyrhynchus TaxID=3082113 RepID=A0ABN8ZMP3_RANTA|nr:unnamed protein product [Rangifer tarandus platyrhynchus]
MEVYKSILKIQGRSLRLALEASVAEMKGRRATFSLECQAGSQLLLQKDQPRPKRWRLQRNLRAHLGPSGVKLRARALTAREDGGGREGGSAGALTGELRHRRQLQRSVLPGGVSTARERSAHGQLPTRPSHSRAASAVRAPCRARALRRRFCLTLCQRKGRETAQRPATVRASQLGVSTLSLWVATGFPNFLFSRVDGIMYPKEHCMDTFSRNVQNAWGFSRNELLLLQVLK